MTSVASQNPTSNPDPAHSANAANANDSLLRIDNHPELSITPIALADIDFLSDLTERFDQASAIQLVPWTAVLILPHAPRQQLLAALAGCGATIRMRLRIEDAVEQDPLAATLELRQACRDLEEIARWRQLAVEVLAFFCRGAREDAAAQISATHLRCGGARIAPRTLIAEANQLSPLVSQSAELSPTQAAEDFLDHLARNLAPPLAPNLAADSPADLIELPPLLYHSDEYYRRDGVRWTRISRNQLRAEVTDFVRRHKRQITEGFLSATMSVIVGAVLVKYWDVSMPFFLESRTAAPTTRRIITFANGQLDIDEFLRVREPIFRLHDPRWFSDVALPYSFDPVASCPLWLETLSELLAPSVSSDNRIQFLDCEVAREDESGRTGRV